MVHESNFERSADADQQSDMAIMRQVMDKDWVVLRTLALGDQYPELDVEALIAMVERQRAER